MARIGLQLYSINELTQKCFAGSLEKVAEIGYDGVEFFNYYNTSAKELRKILDAIGIQSAGSHINVEKLEDNLKQVIEFSMEINDPYIICPRLPEYMRDSSDAYKRTAELFNIIGNKCKDNGIKLVFHHHEHELQQYNGDSGLDILCKYTQPDLLYLELEVYWLECCGLVPADVISKYNERCISLHISDIKSLEKKTYTEIGKGIVDIKALITTAKKYNVEWYNVEQEEYEIPQLQSIQESLNYLRTIL
ncbi:MAG TPA: sugar phosphate isomerase/epimerase [Ruminiclostridium sp.]